MSYGPNVAVMVQKAASYVDHIIKGENRVISRLSSPLGWN